MVTREAKYIDKNFVEGLGGARLLSGDSRLRCGGRSRRLECNLRRIGGCVGTRGITD